MPLEENLDATEYGCPDCQSTIHIDKQTMFYFCRDCGEHKKEKRLVAE